MLREFSNVEMKLRALPAVHVETRIVQARTDVTWHFGMESEKESPGRHDHGHDHHDRRRRDLLQGRGGGSADRVQPWLATVVRRLGLPDDVLPAAGLPGDRSRPPG